MSTYIKTASELISEMKMNRAGTKLVSDWRKLIPYGSRWNPKDPGDPACKECQGTGYLRIEGLSVGHPAFGKIFLCDCTKGKVKQLQPMPKEYTEPEPPPFMDDPMEEMEQAAFDTGEVFRKHAEKKRVR